MKRNLNLHRFTEPLALIGAAWMGLFAHVGCSQSVAPSTLGSESLALRTCDPGEPRCPEGTECTKSEAHGFICTDRAVCNDTRECAEGLVCRERRCTKVADPRREGTCPVGSVAGVLACSSGYAPQIVWKAPICSVCEATADDGEHPDAGAEPDDCDRIRADYEKCRSERDADRCDRQFRDAIANCSREPVEADPVDPIQDRCENLRKSFEQCLLAGTSPERCSLAFDSELEHCAREPVEADPVDPIPDGCENLRKNFEQCLLSGTSPERCSLAFDSELEHCAREPAEADPVDSIPDRCENLRKNFEQCLLSGASPERCSLAFESEFEHCAREPVEADPVDPIPDGCENLRKSFEQCLLSGASPERCSLAFESEFEHCKS